MTGNLPNYTFDTVMQERGGVFSLDSFPQDHPYRVMERLGRGICDFVVANEFRVRRSIHFGFLSHFKIYAVAKSTTDDDYIGVSIGAVAIFLDVFDRVLSDRTIWPDVGRPSLESSTQVQTHIPWEACNIDFNGPRPQCPIRRLVAFELANLAFQFLVCHELTHIQQGHLEYLKHLASQGEMAETNTLIGSGPDAVTRQAMELLADAHGAARVLRRATQGRRDEVYSRFTRFTKRALRAVYGTPQTSAYFPLFAIAIAWRIFDEQYWDTAKLSTFDHPPIPTRQAALNCAILNFMNGYPDLVDLPKDQALDVIVRAHVHAESVFLKLTGQDKNLKGIEAIQEGSPTHQHMLAVLERMRTLEEELRPFSWGQPGVQLSRGNLRSD